MNVSGRHRVTAAQIAMEAREKPREILMKYLLIKYPKDDPRSRSCLSAQESGTVWEEWYMHTSNLKDQREREALPCVKQEAKKESQPQMFSEVEI